MKILHPEKFEKFHRKTVCSGTFIITNFKLIDVFARVKLVNPCIVIAPARIFGCARIQIIAPARMITGSIQSSLQRYFLH